MATRRGFLGGLLAAAFAPAASKATAAQFSMTSPLGLELAIEGIERMRIDSTGNMGVGSVKDTPNAYSVAYNLQSARQDEFGECFYPTVVIEPELDGEFIQEVFERARDGKIRFGVVESLSIQRGVG